MTDAGLGTMARLKSNDTIKTIRLLYIHLI
jgi:hypothetical protein